MRGVQTTKPVGNHKKKHHPKGWCFFLVLCGTCRHRTTLHTRTRSSAGHPHIPAGRRSSSWHGRPAAPPEGGRARRRPPDSHRPSAPGRSDRPRRGSAAPVFSRRQGCPVWSAHPIPRTAGGGRPGRRSSPPEGRECAGSSGPHAARWHGARYRPNQR